MRNRRTRWAVAAALALSAVSVVLYACSSRLDAPASGGGWQVTLLKNGKPLRMSRHSEWPANIQELYPEASAGAPFALLVEPCPTHISAGIGSIFAEADRGLVEFLLMLPPATLLVCLFRNVVGLNSFGAFAPALLGLAFRDVDSPLGVFVVLTIISAGWWLRRGLEELRLLQAPRTALMLSCIVVLLLTLIAVLSGPGPRTITLFPLVILTGMIERFWSMEEEDGAADSLSVLASTLLIAACVWALAAVPIVPNWMMRHPETIGWIMAAQLLLGRYTGFRLLELYRFRALLEPRPGDL
jgi:hypothetical protein